jgi:hypothetical protein
MKENYKDPIFREKVKDAREDKGVAEKIRLSRTPELRKKIGEGASRSWSDPLQLRKRIDTLLRKLEVLEDRKENSLTVREVDREGS